MNVSIGRREDEPGWATVADNGSVSLPFRSCSSAVVVVVVVVTLVAASICSGGGGDVGGGCGSNCESGRWVSDPWAAVAVRVSFVWDP